MALHQGAFDYEDDPSAWENQINCILGLNFQYSASVGNHDVAAWNGANEDQSLLEARLDEVGWGSYDECLQGAAWWPIPSSW